MPQINVTERSDAKLKRDIHVPIDFLTVGPHEFAIEPEMRGDASFFQLNYNKFSSPLNAADRFAFHTTRER